VEPPPLNVVKQVELAVLTVSSLRPATVLPAGATEGRVATQEDVHCDAQGPEVAPFIVLEILVSVLDEGLHNLRGHELSRADWSVEQRSCVGAATRVELDAGPEVKITQSLYTQRMFSGFRSL